MRYLSLCDAVDDGLQCFVAVTLEDSLDTAGSGGNGLPHRHVQVVVVFLGCKVLNRVRKEKSTVLLPAVRLSIKFHANMLFSTLTQYVSSSSMSKVLV